MDSMQPSLFDRDPSLDSPVVTPPLDLDAMATRIAANARFTDHIDRTSEAARDQGHGTPQATLDEPDAVDRLAEQAVAYTIDTRLINGQVFLCAIEPDGNILTSRGLGDSSSPELYVLVAQEADNILATKK